MVLAKRATCMLDMQEIGLSQPIELLPEATDIQSTYVANFFRFPRPRNKSEFQKR